MGRSGQNLVRCVVVLADGLSGLSRSRRSCHVRRETDERFVARRVVRHMAAMGCALEASTDALVRGAQSPRSPASPSSAGFGWEVQRGQRAGAQTSGAARAGGRATPAGNEGDGCESAMTVLANARHAPPQPPVAMESAPPLVARAKQLAELRAARKAAKAAAVTESEAAEARRIKELTDRAKANGQVEKTAGESGAAGALRRKWEKWLACVHGRATAERLNICTIKKDLGKPRFLLLVGRVGWTSTATGRRGAWLSPVAR